MTTWVVMHDDQYALCCCLTGRHSWLPFYRRRWRVGRKIIYRGCIDCGYEELA